MSKRILVIGSSMAEENIRAIHAITDIEEALSGVKCICVLQADEQVYDPTTEIVMLPGEDKCKNPECNNPRARHKTHCSADCYKRHYHLDQYRVRR